MARFDYLKPNPKPKPNYYKPVPKPTPKEQQEILDKPGLRPAFWQTNNTDPVFGYWPTGPTKPVPWQNPLPEQHNRPAYFNNRSTQANYNRWLDSFEQPEKAIEVIEKDYQQYKADMDAIMARNESLYDKPTPKTFSDWMNYNPFSDAFGEVMGAGWEDPGTDLETVFGRRYSQELAEKNYAYPSDNRFLTDYQGMDQARETGGKAYQLEYALNQASPFFQPITDEYGNVLAPAPLTPKEYAAGVTDGKIYDPNMSDSLPQYGKTQLVIEDGQLIPYEMWYRSKVDEMGLFGGNWNLPMFSDTEGYQYNAPGMNFQGNQMRWLDIQNFVNLKNFENKTNKIGIKTDGTMGMPGQAMPFGFNPGIDFQIPNQIHSGTETVEDPNLGEDLGGGGGWGGWGDSGGYGPSYWGNPGSSGYYGNQNYGPNYWGNSGGYGSNGYSGSNSYGPNYQNNQYGVRKGQYFSQLARWVI